MRGRAGLCALWFFTAAAAVAEPIGIALPPGTLAVDRVRAGHGEPARIVVATERGLVALSLAGESVGRLDRGDSRTFLWCTAEAASGRRDVFVAMDRGRVLRWSGGAAAPQQLLTDRDAKLPAGVVFARFARDWNGDGEPDVALPSFAGVDLWTEREGSWRLAASVRHEVRVDLDVDGPDDAEPEVAREVRVPRFDVEDQNGDGVPDLVFDDGERVRFFWSRPDGSLPREPTFELDLAALRAALPPRSSDVLDTGNLLSALESRLTHVERDLDGDGVFDLLLVRGRKVSLYRGTRHGVDRSRAAQVLRTGGNLLHVAVFDEDGDGSLDLSLLLAEDVGLADILRWVVVGGEIRLDLYTYRQRAPLAFARKPSARRHLVVNLPSLRSLARDVTEQWRERLGKGLRLPVVGDLDGDGDADDVARLGADGTLRCYVDAAPAGFDWSGVEAWRSVLGRFDREADDEGRVEVDLDDLFDWAPIPGRGLLARVAERRPDREIRLGPEEGRRRVAYALELDGEAGDELVVAAAAGGEAPPRLWILAAPLKD